MLHTKILNKINAKTKPIGALGDLENLAFKIACIQKTDTPEIKNPHIVVFAGDHGIAAQNEVNLYPQEVTAQMVYNFANGGAAINVFCNTNKIKLKVVDAGVNYTFPKHLKISAQKIDFGTKNFQIEPAMHMKQCLLAFKKAEKIITQLEKKKCNIIGFGEMGIGNTSSASLLMSYFTKIPIQDCVGSGTGLNKNQIEKKQHILTDVFNRYQPKSPMEALSIFGGFEIVMICSAILKAYELKMTIIIDGFIVTSALLAALAINPKVIDNCIFAHTSNEQGHEKMLHFLKVKPLLSLNLRLGEGTGAALAFPLIIAAVNFINQMSSFEDAGVSSI